MRDGEVALMGGTVIWEKQEAVGVVTLNRPEKLNAFNRELFSDLGEVLGKAAGDEGVKAVVITGAGRAFSAGGDREGHPSWKTQDPIIRAEYVREAQRITLAIRRMPKPVIAAVNGVAMGAGLDLAMACDIRIASREARFSEIFIRAGLMPDMGGTYFLPRLVGVGKAMELILTGDTIDAQEALRIGLVNQVVPAQELMGSAMAMARRFCQGPSRAYGFAKWAVYKGLNQDLEGALDNETYGQAILLGTEDVREAFNAFSQKRQPLFKGK